MKYHLITAAALSLLAFSPSIASAQPAARHTAQDVALSEQSNTPSGAESRYVAQFGTACVKLCPTDQNPCDPPYFKDGDGRCTAGD
jgi:hypothetical protein